MKHSQRNGVAIPMVMGFAFLASVFVFMIMSIRVEDKKQNLMSFQQLKAHYMAQGAIQHAFFKIRILPNEVFDASQIDRGLCDDSTGTLARTSAALDFFRSDISSTSAPEFEFAKGDFSTWTYEVPAIRAISAFQNRQAATDLKERKVAVLEIEALATIEDRSKSDKNGPNRNIRKEIIKKTIEITRTSL